MRRFAGDFIVYSASATVAEPLPPLPPPGQTPPGIEVQLRVIAESIMSDCTTTIP
jgi:hypothetical protein